MNALAATTRSWPMLGALGAGLVLAALAAGAGGAPQVVLAGLGVAALGWGGLSLHAGRIVAPRSVLAVSAAALVGLGLLVTAGAMADVAALPLAAASAFIMGVALSVAVELRRRRPRYRRRSTSSPAADVPAPNRAAVDGPASLLGLVGGAALVAALATPALAATDAGRQAAPHGEHGVGAPLDGADDPGHSH